MAPIGAVIPIQARSSPGAGPLLGILLQNHLRLLIHQPGQCRPLCALVQANAPQTVDDPPLRGQQIQITGSAHQLRHQPLLYRKTHLIRAVKGKGGRPLHGRLGNFRQLCAHEMLSQQHAEHRRLRRIFRGSRGQMQPGCRGIGRKQQLLPPLPAAQMEDQGIPAGLMDLIDPRPQTPLPNLLQNGR